MEEPKLQVREWTRLKLVGRPVMTSRDSWVAIRPVPRLLHLYYDSNLRALLRFPEDPIFLLFAPSQEDIFDGEYVKVSTSEPGFSSLLVITSDGCLWWISHINFYESTNRPAKRLKQNVSRQSKAKSNKGTDEWDIFEDCDIYKDTDLYPSHDVHAGSELAWASTTKTHMLYKLLNSHTRESSFRKVQVRCVQPENVVGKFPGVCLAAAGPDNLIAVASHSRSPILFTGARLLSTDISSGQGTSSSNDCHSNQKTLPSSLLFATMKSSKHRSQLGSVILSPRLFNTLCQGFVGARPKHLLLQGNSAGEVHIFSIDPSNQISSSMVLCDLQEPISGLVAYPFDEDCDGLLVLSSHGCLIAITPFISKCTSTPFFPSVSEFSLRKLFRIDMKDAFDVHSLRVKAPVVSATLYGSDHLCFCSASSVCIFSIIENVDGKPSQKQSHGASTRAASEEVVRKKSLVCKTIPINDVFVALAGQGPCVVTKTRSLVALTSRGRLLALKLSDDILAAQRGCFILKNDVKSWKSRVKTRDENVMVLLNEIAAIESCTEALEVMRNSIDLAISELAIALRLTHDVLTGKDRYTVRSPHRSSVVPSMTGLHCNLEVNLVMPTVSLKRLCFSPVPSTQTSKPCHQYAEQSMSFKLCLKVTLSNCSSFPVSSYWTLLLDIHGLEEASSKMYFSSVINDGYGLAPGASSEMAFQISCVEESLNLLEASVYLCHIHENHDDVLQASPKLMKNLLEPMEALSSRSTTKNGNLNASSRAVCILLARYRVDILSLLRPPQRLQCSSDFHPPHHSCLRRRGADAENYGTDKLRPFLVKLQLGFTRRSGLSTWNKLIAVEKWKAFQLEDLKKCCALSKDGEELSGTDIHGNTMVLALNNKELGREGLFSREIQISASTPLMGCMVREAVLWRWKQDFGFQKTVEPDMWGSSQNMDLVFDFLERTQKRLDLVRQDAKNLESLWCANHLEQSGMPQTCPTHIDFSTQSVGEAYTVFKHILEMYMSYRENDASNPFWRCVLSM